MTEKSGQLKEAIEVLKKVRHWIDYGAGELEPTANTVIEAIDTVVSNYERQPTNIRATEIERKAKAYIEQFWYEQPKEVKSKMKMAYISGFRDGFLLSYLEVDAMNLNKEETK